MGHRAKWPRKIQLLFLLYNEQARLFLCMSPMREILWFEIFSTAPMWPSGSDEDPTPEASTPFGAHQLEPSSSSTSLHFLAMRNTPMDRSASKMRWLQAAHRGRLSVVQERHDAFALGKQSVFMWLEIGVPARGELSTSSKAVGQAMSPNHSGCSSKAARGLSQTNWNPVLCLWLL